MSSHILRDGELVLFGPIGTDLIEGQGFTADDVYYALAALGRETDVTVRINSGGGYAREGVAIYNALKAHRGKISVVVESMAASAASIIAMAGDDVLMRTGAIMMLHDPSALTVGTSIDHEKSAEMLEVEAASMADIYAEKSGRTPAQCRADMKAELWLTAPDAVGLGYADRVDEGKASAPTAFDFRLYARAPERLVTMAVANGWARAKAPSPPPPPAPAVIDESRVAAAVEIAALCAAAGESTIAERLIREGATVAVARENLEHVRQVREKVALARRSFPLINPALADRYLSIGTSLEEVGRDLLDRMAAAQSPEILTSHGGGLGEPGLARSWSRAVDKVNRNILTPADVYARRRDERADRTSSR